MKKIFTLFLSLLIAISIIGCTKDSSDSNDLNGSKSEHSVETPNTLFNASEPSIWYLHARAEDFGKDYKPHNVFVFEKGQVTVYYNPSFTYGDISKMNGDEVIENLNNDDTIKPLTQEVVLHIYTDSTGNKVEREVLIYNEYNESSSNESGFFKTDDLNLGLLFPMSQGLEIYDSAFAGFVSDRYADALFLTKVDGHFGFALDEIGTEGIEVD